MNKHLIILSLVVPMALSGCSHMPSWMGGKKEEKVKLAGDRIAVLPINNELQPDETIANLAVTLPPVTSNAEWPQHTGIFSAASSNLAASSFDNITPATAGEGEDFDHALLPRPVVGGGMVYSMDAIGAVSAHDAANITSIRWHSKGVSEEDEPSIMGGGLAYDQGRLYLTSGRGMIAALDASTGKEMWRKALHLPFRSAPKIADNRLFAITIDNQIYALNANNGEVLWNARGINESAGLMNAVSPTIANDMVIVPYSSGEIYVLSAATGKEIWSITLSPGKRTQASAFFAGIGGDLIVDDSVIFAVNSAGLLSVLSLANGQAVWERPIGAINTPWVAGDYMYLLASDQTLLCFVKYSGRIRWATKLASFEDEEEKKDPITWKGPVLTDGKLAVVSSHGQLLFVSATDGKVVATKSVPEGIYTAPVIAGGRMYLLGQNATLYSLQ